MRGERAGGCDGVMFCIGRVEMKSCSPYPLTRVLGNSNATLISLCIRAAVTVARSIFVPR